MFWVVSPPIIRSAYNYIYNFWYLSNRNCYLLLSQQVAVTVWQVPEVVNIVVCTPDDGWRYHPKHVEQFPEVNKLCNVASCWIYIWIDKKCTFINVFNHITLFFSNTFLSLTRPSAGCLITGDQNMLVKNNNVCWNMFLNVHYIHIFHKVILATVIAFDIK